MTRTRCSNRCWFWNAESFDDGEHIDDKASEAMVSVSSSTSPEFEDANERAIQTSMALPSTSALRSASAYTTMQESWLLRSDCRHKVMRWPRKTTSLSAAGIRLLDDNPTHICRNWTSRHGGRCPVHANAIAFERRIIEHPLVVMHIGEWPHPHSVTTGFDYEYLDHY